jgi:hypothetical protein
MRSSWRRAASTASAWTPRSATAFRRRSSCRRPARARSRSRFAPARRRWLLAPTTRRRAAKCVAWVLALRVGADHQAVGVSGGHVFGGVDRDVDLPREQRFLDLLDEDAARADLAEGLRPVLVPRCRDRDERDLVAVAAQPLGRELGLGQRETATPAADPDQHRVRTGAGLRLRTLRRRRRRPPPSAVPSGRAATC